MLPLMKMVIYCIDKTKRFRLTREVSFRIPVVFSASRATVMDMENMLPLMKMVICCIDKTKRFHLTPEVSLLYPVVPSGSRGKVKDMENMLPLMKMVIYCIDPLKKCFGHPNGIIQVHCIAHLLCFYMLFILYL